MSSYLQDIRNKGVAALALFAIGVVITIIAIVIAFTFLKYRVTTFYHETTTYTKYQNLLFGIFQLRTYSEPNREIDKEMHIVVPIGKVYSNLLDADIVKDHLSDQIEDYLPEYCYKLSFGDPEFITLEKGPPENSNCDTDKPYIDMSFPFPVPNHQLIPIYWGVYQTVWAGGFVIVMP
jgi:uncharacterized protein YhhL (DUF1145 family)